MSVGSSVYIFLHCFTLKMENVTVILLLIIGSHCEGDLTTKLARSEQMFRFSFLACMFVSVSFALSRSLNQQQQQQQPTFVHAVIRRLHIHVFFDTYRLPYLNFV